MLFKLRYQSLFLYLDLHWSQVTRLVTKASFLSLLHSGRSELSIYDKNETQSVIWRVFLYISVSKKKLCYVHICSKINNNTYVFNINSRAYFWWKKLGYISTHTCIKVTIRDIFDILMDLPFQRIKIFNYSRFHVVWVLLKKDWCTKLCHDAYVKLSANNKFWPNFLPYIYFIFAVNFISAGCNSIIIKRNDLSLIFRRAFKNNDRLKTIAIKFLTQLYPARMWP